jgi:hypothetical protein
MTKEMGTGRLTDVEQLPQYYPDCSFLLGNRPNFNRAPVREPDNAGWNNN